MTSAADSSARRERLFQARDTAGRGGRGYSRFVRSLRLALPLLAGALLILTTIWPNVDWWNAIVPDGLNVTIDPRDAQQLRMDNARLVGSDENGQPFELSATEARQGPDGVDSIILQAPAGKIELKDGVHLKMQANTTARPRNWSLPAPSSSSMAGATASNRNRQRSIWNVVEQSATSPSRAMDRKAS